MRIFITGAAGFIGSALANKMVEEGHYVRGLDDLSTGDPERLLPDVEFIRGDINDRPKLWTLLQDVDCVYHVAARVVVPESVLYPREYNLVNVGGTVTLMEAMRDVGVRRVVFTSSGAIYGNQSSQPVKDLPSLNHDPLTRFPNFLQNIIFIPLVDYGVLKLLTCEFSMLMDPDSKCLLPIHRSSRTFLSKHT